MLQTSMKSIFSARFINLGWFGCIASIITGCMLIRGVSSSRNS